MIKTACPVCESKELHDFYKSKVPTLQNRVYENEQEAINCNQGIITLTFCSNCRFVFNSTFDESILVYDSHYNNNVPSKIFNSYYHEIANYLYTKYDLKDKVIYDIGCGKGIFLKLICSLFPDVQGIGIDPSYEGPIDFSENVTFIKDIFKSEHVSADPGLIICRHVLEHMEQPKQFVTSIFDAFDKHQNIPFFIEIPEFTWILQNETYWDICYEHTNYFSDYPVSQLFQNTNGSLKSIKRAFSEQYLWVEGMINTEDESTFDITGYNQIQESDVNQFKNNFKTNLQNNTNRIKALKATGSLVTIWGMATKGVIYSLAIESEQELLNFCVDINTDKQNQYAPVTAKKINAPEVLTNSDEHKSVIVMNMNYVSEIKEWLDNNVKNYTIYDALLNEYAA